MSCVLQLNTAVKAQLQQNGLQVTPFTMTKVIQLYETKNSRHSSMLVGKTGSGKSVTWRILQKALTNLHQGGDKNYNIVQVGGVVGGTIVSQAINHRPSKFCPSNFGPLWSQVFPLNPKAMSLGELYGEYDLATDEWADGVLSSLMRSACAGDKTADTPLVLPHLLHEACAFHSLSDFFSSKTSRF